MTEGAGNRVHAPVAGGTRAQLGRFLVIGALTVLVDFATYRLLLASGVQVSAAKGIGFVTGTVFAYFANRRWTFRNARPREGSAFRFAALYASTLGINIGTNALVLAIALRFVPASIAVMLAFLCATGLSAILNFVGMKYWVFHNHSATD